MNQYVEQAKRWTANTIIPAHRVVFVVSTALLGVAGSFVATNPREIPNWLFLIGCMMGMYIGDIFGEVNSEAGTITGQQHLPGFDAKLDAFDQKRPVFIMVMLVAAMILILVGFALGNSRETNTSGVQPVETKSQDGATPEAHTEADSSNSPGYLASRS